MDRKSAWASGALIGAGLMALLDPNRGRTRRALIRNKANSAAGAVGTAAGKTWRDLRHRAEGAVSRGRAILDRDGGGGGGALDARVRSRLGRLTSHPRSITVEAREGRVVLSGPVLAREADALVAGVRSVRGVSEVEDRLERHERAEGIPALQGSAPLRARRGVRENWPPAVRLGGGLAGASLLVAGARRRDWIGGGMAIAGLGLLSRAATNRPLRRLLGLSASRANVFVRKSIDVETPVARAYEFWERWENFPRFFEHVRDVRDEGGGWTRWTVAGPADMEIVFDAVVTATIPNHLIAWKTAPRQPVRHSGLVRLDEVSPGTTRIEVQMTYDPPAGQLGHAVAALFGADPKTALDDDLLRLKSLLEQGRTTAQGREAGLGGAEASPPSAGGSAPPPFLGEPRESHGEGREPEEEGARVPVEFGTPVPREEALEPRPEDAIIEAQDAGVEPLIQTEPGQGAGPADTAVAESPGGAGGAAEEPKPGARRSRKKRTQPPADRVDF